MSKKRDEKIGQQHVTHITPTSSFTWLPEPHAPAFTDLVLADVQQNFGEMMVKTDECVLL